MNVPPDQLASLIAKEIENYSEEIEEKLRDTIEEVANEALQSLRNDPVVKGFDGTGKYAKSFYIKDLYKSRGRNKGFYKLAIHNKKYRIGHLLEYGHAKAGGGRTRAFPHWTNAQKIADTLEDRLREVIEG